MAARRWRRGLLVVLGLGLVLAGAGAVNALSAAAKPGLTLQVAPASKSITRGQTASFTVSVTGTNGFGGAVALTASGRAANSTATFAPPSVTLAPNATATSTLSIATTSTTTVGSYSLTITGTSGKVSGSVSASLTVNYPLSGSLSMTATPATATMNPGSTAVYSIQLARTNLSGPVSFTVASGLPRGASASYSPDPTAGDMSSLQVATTSSVATGTYTLYLVASAADANGATKSAYASVQLVITTSGKAFTITGAVPGLLAPGVSQPLNLAMSNPNNSALSLTNLTVTVRSVTKSAGATGTCTTADYAVTQYSGPYPLSIPKNTTTPVSLASLGVAQSKWPQVRMLNTATNQDGCKGATLSLAYTGSGSGS